MTDGDATGAVSKDVPIIFSGPMVRALLDGRKTMTRRLLKPQPEPCDHSMWPERPSPEWTIDEDGAHCALCGNGVRLAKTKTGVRGIRIPARVGDRLWVRENFSVIEGGPIRDGAGGAMDFVETEVRYAADGATGRKITPCIHMPRVLSRLTLIVTDVKIERLQDISNEDAIAEGASARPKCSGFGSMHDGWSMDWSRVGQHSRFATNGPGPLLESDVSLGDPIAAFASFLNELHGGPRWNLPGRPEPIWDQNPEVVALTFRVEKTNIDAIAPHSPPLTTDGDNR